jgi:hypothetical protein
MDPLKVQRLAIFEEQHQNYRLARHQSEAAYRKALCGNEMASRSGGQEDWKAWEEALSRELEAFLDFKEAWEALCRNEPWSAP